MAQKGQFDQPVMLIVKDHTVLHRVMREFLQSTFRSCSFREAADGATALAVCHGSRPQLVLMDIGLPDANGIDLTARLRTLYPGIEVNAVSRKSSEVHVYNACAPGARACVSKDRIATSLAQAVAVAIGIEPASVTGASW